MATPELIELSDESDDGVQILEERSLPAQGRERSQPGNSRQPQRRRRRSSGDIEILRVNQIEQAPQMRNLPVLHLPDGNMALPRALVPQPPRRSFEQGARAEQISARIRSRQRAARLEQIATQRERHRIQQNLILQQQQDRLLHQLRQAQVVEQEQQRFREAQEAQQMQERQRQLQRNPLDIFRGGFPYGINYQQLGRNIRVNPGNIFDAIFRDAEAYNEDNDPDYHPRQDRIPDEILQRIQQSEEAEFMRRSEFNFRGTGFYKDTLAAKAATIKAPYTTKIDEDEEYVCSLCGVTLGVGIPDNFEVKREDAPLALLQEQNDVKAPYQALDLITTADRDLSKRIFMARCGHVYCGRCVNNISRVKTEMKLKKLTPSKIRMMGDSISNPSIYAPLKCIGATCDAKLRGKNAFSEVFP